MVLDLPDGKYSIINESKHESLTGHLYSVMLVDTSIRGVFASGSWDGTVRIWTDEGEQLSIKFFFSEPVEGLKFSPDGHYLAAGTESQLWIVDLDTNDSWTVLPDEPVRGSVFCWSDDSTKMALILYDHTLRLYDIKQKREIGIIDDIPSLGGTGIDWRGSYLVLGLMNGNIALYDMDQSKFRQIKIFEGHTDMAGPVKWINNEEFISGSADGTVRIWNVAESEGTILFSSSRNILTVDAYLGEPSVFVAGSEHSTIIIPQEGEAINLSLEGSSSCNIAVDKYGKYFVRGIGDHDVQIFNLSDGQPVTTIKGHFDYVNAAIIKNNFIFYGSNDKSIHIIDLETGAEESIEGHNETVSTIAITPDKSCIATGSFDDTIKLWSTETKELLVTIDRNSELTSALIFSRDGEKLFGASGGDFSIRAYLRTGELVFQEHVHEDFINCLAASPNLSGFFSGSDDGSIIWWTEDEGKARTFVRFKTEVTKVTVSLDGKKLAGGASDGVVKLLDSTGTTLQEFSLGQKIRSVAFSPNGHWLAIGSHNKLFLKNVQDNSKPFFIQELLEPITEILWTEVSEDRGRFFAISAAREVVLFDIVPTSEIKKEEKPVEEEKVEIEASGISEEMITDDGIHKRKAIVQEVEQKTEKIIPPIEKVKSSLSSVELGSLVIKEYREIMDKLDQMDSLLRSQASAEHQGFQVILKRINRLKPIIREATDEIDFLIE